MAGFSCQQFSPKNGLKMVPTMLLPWKLNEFYFLFYDILPICCQPAPKFQAHSTANKLPINEMNNVKNIT